MKDFLHNLDKSAVLTIIGIILLFSGAVIVTLICPSYIDPTWTRPTSSYQVQMYEISDPNLYIGSSQTGTTDLQFVYHLKEDFTLLAFRESYQVRIVAPEALQGYVTHLDDPKIKLTSRLLMLRQPVGKLAEAASELRVKLQSEWEKEKSEKGIKPNFDILELYEPGGREAFAVAPVDGAIEDWVDRNYIILDDSMKQPYHANEGVIYIHNPKEYRVSRFRFGDGEGWRYDPRGVKITSLDELKSHRLGFKSRAELIRTGEHLFAIEGCWYCHTDQTRTLVQDVVLNGSAEYAAPPSSSSEYIYQHITFPGTRRIGPDLSRVGIKRPSRDWHKGHFWSPKTASLGSIMPAFRHIFDFDPRGTSGPNSGLPNPKFEALYQYLMTKGTRITPPTQAWWLGKDPVNTTQLIEGPR
ncbi:MAG: cbb3-type cytochrome c oxidase subunit II [Parachlamydia sp.]|nr:cbb3-type cytochrome c oxidase subunit II [Parachlamydia sp.]